MNKILRKCVDQYCPKLSKVAIDGTIKMLFRNALDYLDDVFKSSMRELDSNINLVYVGYEEMSPEQVYAFNFVDNQNNSYDIAHSDVYGVYFIFQFNGEMFKQPMLMPYCQDGNVMTLTGTKYVVSPVLSDTVISPKQSEIFVRLLKKKVRFIKNNRNISINDQIIRQPMISVNMFASNTTTSAPLGQIECPVTLYLLAKYGLYGTFSIYIGREVKKALNRDLTFGEGKDILFTNRELTKEDYEKYNVYESILRGKNELPPGVKKLFLDVDVEPHLTKVLVNKEIETTSFIKYLISGLIYILDAFPYTSKHIVNIIKNGNSLQEEINAWRFILGQVMHKGNFTTLRLGMEVENTMRHLDTCLDTQIENKLRDVGVFVSNFYDLLAYILNNYTQLTITEGEYNANLENKYIDVMYYIFFDHIVSINKTIKSLNKKLLKSKLDKNVTVIGAHEVKESFKDEFKYYRIFNLLKGGLKSTRSLCLKAADYTGDIKYAKCTVILEDQSRGEGVKTPLIEKFPDVCKTIKGEDMWLGSIFNLIKKVPSGRLRMNAYLQYDPVSGQILIPDDIKANIDEVNNKLKLTEEEKYEEVSLDIIEDLD